jgi:hypothetical protein
MGDNPGDKEHNSAALSQQVLTHSGDEVPYVTGLSHGGLRGMEANTAESKGGPTDVPPSTAGGTLEECT